MQLSTIDYVVPEQVTSVVHLEVSSLNVYSTKSKKNDILR